MENKVRFTAVDLPNVDSLTVHFLAAVADQEARPARKRLPGRQGTRRAVAYELVSGFIQLLRTQSMSLQQSATRLKPRPPDRDGSTLAAHAVRERLPQLRRDHPLKDGESWQVRVGGRQELRCEFGQRYGALC